MIKKIIWKTFFFSFILFLISCSNGLFTEDDSEPANNGKTYIVVSNKSTISRMALLPITPKAGLSDLTSLALTGERTNQMAHSFLILLRNLLLHPVNMIIYQHK